MEEQTKTFFGLYERFFNDALAGQANLDRLSSFYSEEFIAAGPNVVKSGKNDDQFKKVMEQGYQRYRAIGTKAMQVRHVGCHDIDGGHWVARVAWTASYLSAHGNLTVVDFEVHYLMEMRSGEPKIFGWIAGDEEALLRANGIID